MSMRKVFRQVAKKYGVSVAQIKRDMQEAITAAYQNPPNDGVTTAWQKQVPCKGEIPTPEEVIRYAAARIKEQ